MDTPDTQPPVTNFREKEVLVSLVCLGLAHVADGCEIELLGMRPIGPGRKQFEDRHRGVRVELKVVGRKDRAGETAGQGEGIAVCEQAIDGGAVPLQRGHAPAYHGWRYRSRLRCGGWLRHRQASHDAFGREREKTESLPWHSEARAPGCQKKGLRLGEGHV